MPHSVCVCLQPCVWVPVCVCRSRFSEQSRIQELFLIFPWKLLLCVELVVRENWNQAASRNSPGIICCLREWVNGASEAGEEGAASKVSVWALETAVDRQSPGLFSPGDKCQQGFGRRCGTETIPSCSSVWLHMQPFLSSLQEQNSRVASLSTALIGSVSSRNAWEINNSSCCQIHSRPSPLVPSSAQEQEGCWTLPVLLN